jgi:MoxR-like ATPase
MLNEKMIAVMSEVGQEIAERGDLIEKMAIALLTGKNLFILGDTGQAKSYAVNLFRKRITGAKQFERLLSKQTDEEQLFGRLDLGSLIPGNVAKAVLESDVTYQSLLSDLSMAMENYGEEEEDVNLLAQKLEAYRKALAAMHSGEPRVITTGKIPECHICFIDEIFKANDGILNALLTALNERRYTNEGYAVDIPVISFFAASNAIPNFADPADSILRPLYDRFELKVVTKYVEDKQARLAMLTKI